MGGVRSLKCGAGGQMTTPLRLSFVCDVTAEAFWHHQKSANQISAFWLSRAANLCIEHIH